MALTDILKPKGKPPAWDAKAGRYGKSVLAAMGEMASVGMILFAAGAAAFIFYVYSAQKDLPDLDQVKNYRPAEITRVWAGDGSPMGEFTYERRIVVDYKDIPAQVKQAFVAAEDQRFYEHIGIDPWGITRSIWHNLTNRGSLQGGSTITQQVVKNILLSSDRTMRRKVREVRLSAIIERVLSKEQILEIYVNEVYLGQRSYGVAAAARTYFSKTLKELTAAEAALLAGLAQAPSRYNPFVAPELAMARRNYVLRRMNEDGYLTDAQYKRALAEKLNLTEDKPVARRRGLEYPIDDIRRQMYKKYGRQETRRGGFRVYSSIDPAMQKMATDALRRGLIAYDRRHGYRGPVLNLGTENDDDEDASTDKEGKASDDADGDETWRGNWRARLKGIDPPAGAGDWKLAVVLRFNRRLATIGLEDGSLGTIPLEEVTWAREQVTRKLKSGRLYPGLSYNRVNHHNDVFEEGDVILVEAVSRSATGKDYPKGTYTLRQIPEVGGALVLLDGMTGRVLAIVGGYSPEISEFNSASQAWRQPGSAFKPIVHLTALENGFTPSTLVLDTPVTIRYRGQVYQPQNYSGKTYGPTTLRRTLELSRNLATIRLGQRVGFDKIVAQATALRLAPSIPAVPSVVLGSRETTAVRLAAAYASFINGGYRVTPTLIDRIEDRDGKIVFSRPIVACPTCSADASTPGVKKAAADSRTRIASAESAFQTAHMLRGVIERGTGRAALKVGRPLGGKTGTTNDSADAWFVGFSPRYVAAVWVGFPSTMTLGPREQGGRTAAPIFADFMARLLKSKAIADFVPPETLVKMTVDARTGLPSSGAGSIVEYFKKGRTPTAGAAHVPDGGIKRHSDWSGGQKKKRKPKFEGIPGTEY